MKKLTLVVATLFLAVVVNAQTAPAAKQDAPKKEEKKEVKKEEKKEVKKEEKKEVKKEEKKETKK